MEQLQTCLASTDPVKHKEFVQQQFPRNKLLGWHITHYISKTPIPNSLYSDPSVFVQYAPSVLRVTSDTFLLLRKSLAALGSAENRLVALLHLSCFVKMIHLQCMEKVIKYRKEM